MLAAHDNCTASLSLQLMLPNVAKEMTSQDAPAPISDTNSDYIRLHVTPFNPELVKVILGSSILPKARNISYHALETFPENSYGFVELPKEDADKLKTKLNGAVLKGVKIRIQPARPATIPEPLGEAAMGGDKSSKRKESRDSGEKTKEKKRKRDQEEITGVVLEEGRKVKRGWTSTDEPSRDKDKKSKKSKKDKKDKKERKQTKSKYTEHEECLVKTILPANVSTSAAAEDAATPEKKKKKKHGTQREVVVHEFEKTTKFPTFLKSTVSSGPAPASLEYVEGKGWVNEEGNVVEAVKSKPQTSYKIKAEKVEKKSKSKREETPVEKESDSDAHDSGDESEDDSSAPASGAEVVQEQQDSKPSTKPKSLLVPESSALPISPGSAKSLTIKIPPTTPDKVHPLEALYKKPQQADGEPSQNASQSFSFFGNAEGDDLSEEDAGAPSSSQQVPMTPFTREDIELRGLRSAAPTPDTAHPSRKFKPWAHEDDDIEEEEAEDDEDGDVSSQMDMDGASGSTGPAPGTGPGESTSDFQKWFWENRGDLNRSWKKRRKMASKEKRYRENKARLARAI